jgi:hypothetical protein
MLVFLSHHTRLASRLTCLRVLQHRCYVQNPKVRRIKQEHPFDVAEEWKRKMENIPRLDDVPELRPVIIEDKILERNLEEYDELQKKGLVPSMY